MVAVPVMRAGFIALDANTGAVNKVIGFQYNPETLVRRLDAATPTTSTAGASTPGVGGASAAAGGIGGGVGVVTGVPTSAPPSPPEFVSFTIAIDAADKLERGDTVAQQAGVYPLVSALEMLLYPQAPTLLVWVSGNKRVVPVRLTQLVFNEQTFDALLNPIRVEASVHLQVLKDADLPANSKGRILWDAHLKVLQQLATEIDAVTLSQMGLRGAP